MRTSYLICSIIMILTDLGLVIPCFYYSCSLDWRPKDHRPFMVFLPPEALDMPGFCEILLRYRRKIIRLTWAEAAIVPLFLFLDVTGQLVLMTIVIFTYLMIPPIFGRRTREELLALKKEKGWVTQYTAVHRADLRLGGKNIRRWTHILFFLSGAVLPPAYACFAAFYLKRLPPFSSLAGIAFLELMLLITAFWQWRRYRTWREEVLHPHDFYSGDEDDYWHMGRFGLYYDNPYDPAVMKNNNSGGMNMNLNRARIGSWIFWTAVWIVVAAPLIYYLAYPEYVDASGELADIRLMEDEKELLVDGRFYHADISIEGLTSVRMIWNLDELGSGERLNGTGTSAYGKGRFRYENCGQTTTYAAYRHPPFLLLTVREGEEEKTYLVNDDNPQNTEEIYDELRAGIPSGKWSN